MATSPFSNPLLESTGVSDVPRPFAPWTPTSDMGIGGLAPSLADMAITGERLVKASQFTMPEMRKPTKPNLGFSPTTNELFVNGLQFSADDAATALQSEQYLSAAPKPLPSGDWIPLNEAQYGQYLQSIRKPSLGQLASKSFGRGVDSMQMLAGRGLQLAGAEETGGRIVEQQMEDLRRTTPYERQFTDIESGRGAVEWLVANFAQQGPNMIESIATAGAGFLAGTAATGNPLGGAAAALAATIGKTAWKESVKAALKKKAAGEALDATENQLLRKAAGVGMATAATFGQSMATGASDIYGELRDQGADADDVSARLKALGGSIPYALADTLPEYLLFSRLLGRGARPGLGTLATRRAKAGEILKRGAIGGGVGGGAEGLGELTQEALLLGLSDQDFGSTENINRLINSFAAGAGVGGPVGAGANIFNPTNLLKPGEKTDPSASAPKVQPTPKTELTVPGTQLAVQPRPEFAGTYGQGAGTFMSGAGGTYMPSDSRELVPAYAPTTPLGAAPGAPLQLPPPVQTLTPMGGPVIMAGMGPGAADVTRQDILLRQQGNVPPGAAPGSQGVLDVFGGTIPAQELSARMQPQQPLAPEDDNFPTVNLSGRIVVIRVVNGVRIPFYLSTGSGGKKNVPSGRWYPFFGVGADGWINKTTEEEMADYYGSDALRQTAQELDRTIGDIRNNKQIPKVSSRKDPRIDFINQGFTPTENNKADTPERVRQNIARVLAALNQQPAVQSDPRQGALQFAGEAPTLPANTQMQNQLQVIQDRRRRQQEFDAVQAQQAADIQQQTEALAQQSANARDLFAMQQGQPPAPFPSRPMVTVQPTQPRQLPLFTRKQAPVPPKAGQLRRGGRMQPAAAPEAVATDETTPQVPMFGDTGEPALPALISAGTTTKVAPKKTKPRATKTAGARGLKKGAKVAEVNIVPEEKPSATQTGKLKKGRVAKRQQDNAGVQGGGDAGEKPATEVKAGGAQAGGGGKPVVSGAGETERKARTDALVKKAETVQAGRQWSTYADRDTQPKWDELTPEQQEQWRKVVIDDGKPNIAATEEIAPPKKAEAAVAAVPETPAEAWDAMDTGVEWAKLSPGQQTEWTDSNRTQATADTIAVTLEAQWKAMSDLPWENLSDKLKSTWGDAKVRDDDLVAKIELGQFDYEEDIRAESDAQDKLSEAINAVENYRGTETDFRTIVDAAYFLKEETNTKDITARAQAYVNKINSSVEPGDSVKKDMLRTATIEVANSSTLAHGNYAKYKTGTNEGTFKPWYILLRDAGLLGNLTIKVSGLKTDEEIAAAIAAGLRPTNLPVSTQKSLKKKPVAATVSRTVSPPIDYVAALKDFIDDLLYATGVARTLAAVRTKAKELYANISEQDRKTIVRGVPLSAFFDADGEPKIIMSRGRPVLTDKAMTTAQQRVLEVEQKDTAKALAAAASAQYAQDTAERQRGIGELKDTEGGMTYRDDGTPITSTVPVGRIRLLIKSFMAKLLNSPHTYRYDNVADLKARNPELFAQANAARSEGDFETVNPVGYSFGNIVIIFSDFIRTEQELKFILAHETLGHFGFRSVVPGPVLDAMLNRIYDADYDVQAAVEAMMSVQGMSKLEAIEEYLADNAADLDSSVISKIWNVLKNALNKLGFEFQDDEARYLVNLARKYVRNGDVGHVVSSKAIAEGLTAIDRASSTGRFARADAGNLVSRTLASVAAIQGSQSNYTGGLLGVANSFAQNVFGKRRDVPGVVARLLEELQTLDNKARRSYGLQQLHMMLEAQSGEAQQLLNKYKSMMEATYTPDVFGLAKGVSEDDKREAGKLLAHAALLRSRKVTDAFLKSFPDLIQLTSADQIDIPHLEAVRKQLEAAGEVTAEEFTKGFDIEYSALGADGKPLTKRFQYDVDTESNVWKVYQEAQAAINESAIDMLLANFESSRAETNRVIGGLNNKRRGSNVFTDMDLAAIRRVSNLYKATRYKSSSVSDASVRLDKQSLADAEALIQSFGRAIASDDIFAVWMKDPAAKGFIANDAVTKGSNITHAEFQKPEYDDIRAQLTSLRSKVADIDASYIVQKAVRDVFLFDYQTRNAELYAKRTILGAYVPFVRRGNEQVRLVAYDLDGNPAELSDDVRSTLPYFQFNDRAEAEDAVADLEKEFGGDNEWTLTKPGPKGAPTPITIKLVPEISRVRRTPDLTEAVNFNEFIYVLNRLNVNLTPTVRERIVTTLTNQNSRARKNLQRSGTEGWDTDVVRSVSEHLETSAHVAAKKMYRHRTDDILLNNSNWLGDSKLLKQLEAAIDNATDDGERARAQKAYDSYAYQYRYMAASSGMNKVTIAGKEVSTLGRGEDYREYAKEILRWYSENTNISESTEDILSGEVGSQLKLMAVVMQLGMSPASAVLNLVSLETHTIPYLAFYNPKHGYGGGYGWMKSATAVHTALANLRSPKLGDAAFLADLVAGKTKNTFGLSDAEISFLFDFSSKGVLQMSQPNAMMGNARGKIFNNNMQGAIKTWMGMFTYTEQLTRRATALATFRLEKERALSQGVPEAQANAEAMEAARVAVNTSQGDHNMYNRPKIGRGNITQFIFMYKMFLVTTVQLLRHMPKEGQLLMLGSLLLLSGMKGLPFAENLMDIVDTIAQKLGLKTASVEKAMAEWIDTVAPGMSPYAMRGVIDRMTGATVSTRTGVGNMLPLTGMFKAGAQPGREIADFVGPVWGALAGSVGMAGNLLRYGADTVGLGNDTTSFNSILRESPVAALRSVGDGLAYLNDGRITNLRGQVVASDVSTNVILARFLGFYPAEATQANDIVRLSKQVADYAKSIKAEYVGAYIKADLRNDTAGVQQVLRNVEQWNQDAAGTGLEISNFAQSANRAAQESKRPLLQRYLKAAPKNVRPETEELMRVLGYN